MNSKSRFQGRSDRAPTTAASAQRRLPLSGNPRTEQKLVNDCVAGNEQAWEELFKRYRDALHLRIRAILRSRSRDANVVDEIAAEVWSTLFCRNSSLLGRFRADDQPLSTFLGGVARIEVLRFLRSDNRRRSRETSSNVLGWAAEIKAGDDGYRLMSVGLGEFADALTPHQRQFLKENLLNRVKHMGKTKLTATNRWQMRHRIRRKLLQFLNGQSTP
jgi:DNA-directed RNA polymerase specialized sigma24 family protein